MLLSLRTYLQHVPGSLSTAVVAVPFNLLLCSLGSPAGGGELTQGGSALAGPRNKARGLQAGTAGTWDFGKKARRVLQEMEGVWRVRAAPSLQPCVSAGGSCAWLVPAPLCGGGHGAGEQRHAGPHAAPVQPPLPWAAYGAPTCSPGTRPRQERMGRRELTKGWLCRGEQGV